MIQGFDPRTGEPVGEPVAETSDAGVDAIVAAAVAAFPAWAAFGRRAEAVSPPTTENANGKFDAANTATGPTGRVIRRMSGAPPAAGVMTASA